MCLIVKEVPTSLHQSMAVECKKVLTTAIFRGRYLTVFRYEEVPHDGILIPRLLFDRKVTDLAMLEGQVIHSYSPEKKLKRFNCKTGSSAHKAYAFGVVAYGDREDIASLALYIPDADKTNLKKERVKFCQKCQTSKNISIDMVVKVFPIMRKSLSRHPYLTSLQKRRLQGK